MAFQFKLPDLGEGVQEGEVVRWLVQEGDEVREDQPLVELMTDKVTAEIPSPVSGHVHRLLVEEGEVVPVGTVLVEIETDGAAPEAKAEARPAAAAPANGGGRAPAPEKAAAPAGERILAVPAVRKLAQELGVDLAAVAPTGPGGRITMDDVRAAAEGAAAPETKPPRAPETVPAPAGEERRVPLRGVRRRIAEHLHHALHQSASATYVDEIDFTRLAQLRQKLQPRAREEGVRLTYLPFIVAAACLALREHPHFNAAVDEETGDLILKPGCHLGIAVHTDDGLLVPVVRDADRRHLFDLAREIQRLADAARAGELTLEEVSGGTFSLSSLGPQGGIVGTPILNWPQVAIAAVHKIVPRPVAVHDQVFIRQMANISLTFDHRYIDGMQASNFVTALINYLQDPGLLFYTVAEQHHR